MHYAELLLVMYPLIVLGLGPLEQRDDARNLRGRHYPVIAVHELQHQRPRGE